MLSIALAFVALLGPIRVVDGDTMRAGSERIGLLGIDAPDNPKSDRCRPYPKPGAICDEARSERPKTRSARPYTASAIHC